MRKSSLDPTTGIQEDPALYLESVTDLWAAAEWAEQEVFNMFGIRFRGHTDSRRILMWKDNPALSPARGLPPSWTRQPRALPANCTQRWINGRWNQGKYLRPSGSIKRTNRASKNVFLSNKDHSDLYCFYINSSRQTTETIFEKNLRQNLMFHKLGICFKYHWFRCNV